MESSIQKFDPQTLPPMLRMYLDYKTKYPDALLFFQVGDFYELFFEDAIKVSKALSLTLTSRDKSSDNPIPMCGVPIAVVDNYIEKLVAQGSSVAVVKQVGDPNAKKGMVERELERIVTPGIRILGAESKAREEVYVAAIYVSTLGEEFSLTYTDVRTGSIFVREGLDREALLSELRFVAPAELILPRAHEGKRIDRRSNWVREIEGIVSNVGAIKFRDDEREGLRSFTKIPGFISLTELSKKAARLLIQYVDETTVGASVEFVSISRESHEQDLIMDASTRHHLELVSNVRDGGNFGTLLSVIDRTVTAQGARKIRQWVVKPSRNIEEIERRLDTVQFLLNARSERSELTGVLSQVCDLERVATRIDLSAANPRELAALRDSLRVALRLSEYLAKLPSYPTYIANIIDKLRFPRELLERLLATLEDEPSAVLNECGIIRSGVSNDLDRLKDIRQNGKNWLAELELKEKEATGISSLKIRFNSVFGYYIEITKTNLEKVPQSYIRKQTMANAERYITPELKKYEDEILSAESKQLELERKIFGELLLFAKGYTQIIRNVSEGISLIDLFLSLSEVAERENLVRPTLVAEKILTIDEGRHPVLAKQLQNDFVPNSLSMIPSSRDVLVITGPNMGGKSTYLRQTAQIVILAQLGSFVFARAARIGLVDKIFTRIGASDNMLEGESTFMVEMREAAYILTNATDRSLLLIDELGRGTATQDGLSIAQATLEWIVSKLSARTLFATHFHELTELVGKLPGLVNLSVGSKDIDGEIIFTHSICEGPANRSYGLEVARIAGLPNELIARARAIMSEDAAALKKSSGKQISMFGSHPLVERVEKVVEPSDYRRLKEMRSKIEQLEVDNLTPLQALNILSDIKRI